MNPDGSMDEEDFAENLRQCQEADRRIRAELKGLRAPIEDVQRAFHDHVWWEIECNGSEFFELDVARRARVDPDLLKLKEGMRFDPETYAQYYGIEYDGHLLEEETKHSAYYRSGRTCGLVWDERRHTFAWPEEVSAKPAGESEET